MKHLILTLAIAGCGTTEEAALVELPVTTAAAPLAAAETDLGYTVQVTSLRVAVTQIQFTIEGEMHADVGPLPPNTIAHPGHSAGGEVTGELPGDFILTWNGQPRAALGTGTLIAGDYQGANFMFRVADQRDALPSADPLVGHTFHLTGTITKDATTRDFDAVLDLEPGALVIGAVFEATIDETTTAPLELAFYATDSSEGDTAFDGIDFFALPTTATGAIEIRPGGDAHNILRRTIQTHDHYGVIAP
jgi:hypothetical protein